MKTDQSCIDLLTKQFKTMKQTEVTYSIMSDSLEETLHLISEMESITGMEPEDITMENGNKIGFNKSDFKKLCKGGIGEEEYVTRNLITTIEEK